MYYDQKESGKRIAALRKEKGMTQEQLAEKLNISTSTLGKIASFRILPEIAVQPLHQLHSTEVPTQIGSFYQIKIMSSELNAPPAAKTGIIGMHTFTWNHF